MAIRVTASEVKEILETGLSDARINAFIVGASKVVDNALQGELDANTLKEIERWLAAHYVASTIERQAIMEKGGPAEQKFSDVFGKNLQSTTYGMAAVGLDTTGILAGLGQKRLSIIAVKE